jgi:glycine cleavage system protein P-like pyridoxal-binding family
VQNIGKEDRLNLFRKKFYAKGEIREKHDYYDQWVKLARRYEPTISASEKNVNKYLNIMNEIVEEHYNTTLRRDLRMSDYLRRIPDAIARSSFSPVDNKVLLKAETLIDESIETWAVK